MTTYYGIPAIGTPEEFEAQFQVRETLDATEETITARIAALSPEQLAAFRAHCFVLGGAETQRLIEADEAGARAMGEAPRPEWLVNATIIGMAGTIKGDAAYMTIERSAHTAFTAWLDTNV